MIIIKALSLDCSTTCFGWSIFEEDNLIVYGKIRIDDKCIDEHNYNERLKNLITQLEKVVKKYKPQKIYMEEVPNMNKGGVITAIKLGAVHGAVLVLSLLYDLTIEFIDVGTWRSDIGLFTGIKQDRQRDLMKIHSIEKVNELFQLDLKCEYTKSGKYNEKKSDDDIADSILIYCSTRGKYRAKG